MSPPTNAHRAEFSVRCACGIEYHTSDAHIGKVLPCKCGRKVPIVRPPDSESTHARSSNSRDGRTQESASTSSGGRRRRKVTKRRYVPSQFWAKFGKAGEFVDRANGASARWFARQIEPMFNGSIVKRATAIASWVYLIGAFAAWMLLWYWSEEKVSATIIAYGPRFLALWPFAVLVPAALLFLRRALWPLAVAAVIVLVPIMGFRVSVSTLGKTIPATPAPGTIRILTFNTQGGDPLSYDLAIMLKELAPDVFTFQECGERLWEVIGQQQGWYSKRYGNLCTGSRWEIASVDEMPREDLARVSKYGFGGAGLVMRTIVNTPKGPLALVNLHLETARRGLEAMLGSGGALPGNLDVEMENNPFNRNGEKPNETDISGISTVERFRRNVLIRDTESDRASKWALSGIGDTPVLIAGDFNLPVESTIFRDHWGKFVDAFEAKGNGMGWSKHEGKYLRVRIDHLLSVKGGLSPIVIQVIPDYRSDHRPVVADYAWPASTGAKP